MSLSSRKDYSEILWIWSWFYIDTGLELCDLSTTEVSQASGGSKWVLETHDHSQRNLFYFQNNNICQTRMHSNRMPTDRCSCCHKMSAQGCMMSLPVWSYALPRWCIRDHLYPAGSVYLPRGSASPPHPSKQNDWQMPQKTLPSLVVSVIRLALPSLEVGTPLGNPGSATAKLRWNWRLLASNQ